MNMKLFKKLSALLFTLAVMILPVSLVEAKPLDEIINYDITAEVLDDSSVDLTYNISWKVLDSDSEGPLSWVKIGIPNKHCNFTLALSDNIDNITTDYSSGTYVKVYFDREYYKDEVVNFSYKVNMNNMYYYDPDQGYATYTFTPGWFDGINVDNLTIRWNSDNIDTFTPSCQMEGGYHTWNSSLSSNEKYTVTVTYPGDAYAFTVFEKEDSNDYVYSEHSLIENVGFTILCIICFVFMIAVCFAPVAIPALIIYVIYKSATGFTTGSEKKITRTVIEYYPSCPNCGGSREEGKDTCQYCDSSMIKSKQEIKEEDVKKNHQDLLKFDSNGTYKYSSDPNRYVRVNVVSVPHVVSRPASRGSSGHHSSCAHSSCACACACACAGGGRAGCTTKDFYNTRLKVKHIKKVLEK